MKKKIIVGMVQICMLIGCGTVWNGDLEHGTDTGLEEYEEINANSQNQSVVRNANATIHDSDSDFEIALGTLFSDFTYETNY